MLIVKGRSKKSWGGVEEMQRRLQQSRGKSHDDEVVQVQVKVKVKLESKQTNKS